MAEKKRGTDLMAFELTLKDMGYLLERRGRDPAPPISSQNGKCPQRNRKNCNRADMGYLQDKGIYG